MSPPPPDTGGLQPSPSGVARIDAPGAWNLGFDGYGIGVAIVDTGLDFGHADLAVNIATVSTGDYCFDAFNGDCGDANGHGTHVGGIVAAIDDEFDVVGVAPQATLYAVRVLDAAGSGTDSTVIAGLEWVLDHADVIDVVNMSLGRSSSNNGDGPMETAVSSGA